MIMMLVRMVVDGGSYFKELHHPSHLQLFLIMDIVHDRTLTVLASVTIKHTIACSGSPNFHAKVVIVDALGGEFWQAECRGGEGCRLTNVSNPGISSPVWRDSNDFSL